MIGAFAKAVGQFGRFQDMECRLHVGILAPAQLEIERNCVFQRFDVFLAFDFIGGEEVDTVLEIDFGNGFGF